MKDEPEDDEEMIEAAGQWLDACNAQVDAEIQHAIEPSEENAEKLEQAAGEVEAAQDLVLDIIREQKNAAAEPPYRGPFRE